MNPEKALAKLEVQKGDLRYAEIESLLNHYGFTDKETNHTVMWKHPLLLGSGPFPTGRFQIGRHFNGVDGRSSSTDAHRAFKAIDWVIDKLKELEEHK